MAISTSCNRPEPVQHSGLSGRTQTARSTKADALPYGGISELFLTERSPELSLLLMPLLAHLSRDDCRWITWIGPSRANRQLLEAYGVDIRRVRFVTTKGDDQRWMLWEALRAGTSHTVIADGSALSEEDLAYLDQAAQKGNSRALLIRRQ
ncbi:SulA-like leucine-rich domain-containing protein [Pseudomaricurvus sp. HS19]|uniref:SulA-like leucine-rich domain-containing protein n=1 Tax=Pseudomaricurvus sp. HS19 TaxID=2692626 RepID=UPI00136F33EA|nr:SulA-like leucine-rich domain-containing protein [Pseudomaricurvus sp. HS19]MYM62125.1 hypothetical protein [Pseudomaricurvus sp. HS19]